jgi:hypothetical protein
VQVVRENLKVAQSRKKSYADTRRWELTFEQGEFVYLKVSPIRGLRIFKVKGKLSPRYIGLFRILQTERRCSLSIRATCATIRYAQHVPHITIEKCLRVSEEQLLLEELNVQDDLTYTKYRVQIMDTLETIIRSKRIRMCKVQ